MMNDKKIEVLMKSVDKMKAKGVTGIKLELEAQLYRSRHSGGGDYDDCDHCDEDNQVRCDSCRMNDYAGCDGCDNGWIECPECGGTGRVNEDLPSEDNRDWYDERVCFDWLMNKLAEKTNTTYRGERVYQMTNPLPWVRFAKFYNDGSVDSELTITVPIDNPENVKNIPKILEAFKEMAEAMGAEINVSGAGMHTAVIFSPDCSYPSDADDYIRAEHPDSRRLPARQLDNFKKAMTQLLPALFFLASSNENSRALRYRLPQVSVNFRHDYGMNARYSAVTYRQGAFEFRVFDTCYNEPLTIFDNLVVIANCLDYLSDTYKSPGIERIANSLAFGTDHNDKLDRFYMTTTHIDVLNNGLKKIKPSYYTLRDVKRHRKFNRTKPSLERMHKEQERKAELAYEEYFERTQWKLKANEHSIRSYRIESYLNNLSVAQLRELTDDKLEQAIADEVQQRMDRLKGEITPKPRYIKRLMDDYNSQNVGQYNLSFN